MRRPAPHLPPFHPASRTATRTGIAVPFSPGPKTRRGFTLFELLLVLGLLVILGSMMMPVLTGSFASARLKRAGDQVLTSWSKARTRAVETGRIFTFEFTPESGSYQFGPWDGELIVTESRGAAGPLEAAAANREAAAIAGAAGDDDDPTSGVSGGLPGEIVFQSGQAAVEDPTTGQRRVDALGQSGGRESTPILFFPDGTSSEASVVLADDRGFFVRLTLRGMTGVGRASLQLSRDELDRASGRR